MRDSEIWMPLVPMVEKAMATHSSILAWNIPWTEEPGGLQSMGLREEWDTTEWVHFHFSLSCIGEENGNPLQCSCLEGPRDWGAWWAAVYGVAQSWTWLKRLSSSSSSNIPMVAICITVWWKVKVKWLSRVLLFETPWTVAHQAPPSMGFSRQEYCGGLPFSFPEDLPDLRIEPRSPALQADTLTSEPPGKLTWM